jgi:hypothetical protein
LSAFDHFTMGFPPRLVLDLSSGGRRRYFNDYR